MNITFTVVRILLLLFLYDNEQFFFSSLLFISANSDGSMHITKPNGIMETRALCEQINRQTATEMQAIVHHTTGWYVHTNTHIY